MSPRTEREEANADLRAEAREGEQGEYHAALGGFVDPADWADER